jgi:hypothetical protein
MSIAKYIIIRAETTSELESFVNNRIKDGFRPIGGIYAGSAYYYQPMILFESTEVAN